ncbi:MAG: hypothetical protein PHR39_06580 [Actinomycetota bacterium]|nr:hypothetical protein [Actinomycetota bacterium]
MVFDYDFQNNFTNGSDEITASVLNKRITPEGMSDIIENLMKKTSFSDDTYERFV